MDAKSKPFVPKQFTPNASSLNVSAPTFIPTSANPPVYSYQNDDSLTNYNNYNNYNDYDNYDNYHNDYTYTNPPLEYQALEILCDIFSEVEKNILKSTLQSKGNDLQAAIASLTEMLDQSSSLILDGIWQDHLEEYEELENEEIDDIIDDLSSISINNEEKKSGQVSSAATEFQPVFMFSSSSSSPSSKPAAVPPPTKGGFSIPTKPTPSNNKPTTGTSPAKKNTKPSAPPQEEKVVCKYFLAGQCYRKDCMYLHTSTVCRYWKLGTCSRGDTCIYLHAEEEPKPQKTKTNPPSTSSNKPTPPSFAPPIKQAETPSRPAPAYLKADMAANIKLKQLQTLFQHVEPGNVKSIFYNCNFQVEAATEQISKLYGKPRVVEAPAAPVKQTTYQPVARKPKQWVETGDEVARLYSECREEAIKHATARNTCFQFATMRYLAGDGLAAKEWSKKGRYHDEMMRKLHREACMRILTTRNKDLANEMILDLHGLHKREAIEVLQQKIAMFRKANASRHSGEPPVRVFYVIVGTGHHSTHFGKSLIGRAVTEYLDSEKIKYTDCSDDNRGGMLTVNVK